MARFTLYINFEELIIEKPLPAENNRQITLDFSDIQENCNISFEVFDNIWSIISDSSSTMTINGEPFKIHCLKDSDIIKVNLSESCRFVIMVYEITDNITEFSKYSLENKDMITVGKNRDCDICVDSTYISAEHAQIMFSDNGWVYRDTSLNGSYINGVKINGELELKMFDVIYTVGFKIVFLGNCIAINRKDIAICSIDIAFDDETVICKNEEHLFSRSPRIVEPLFDEIIEIEAPPSPQRQKNQPLLFVIGPSVTMPIPILMSTMINSQLNGGSDSKSYLGILASVGMSAVIGIGWAVAHYVYNKKALREDEEFRVSAYNEYINKNERLIREKQSYDNSVLINRYLSSEDMAVKISKDSSFVWNRNINHEDFLTVRIGTGNVDFSHHLSVPKQRFSLYKDNLTELPHKLKDKYRYINGAVVTLDIKKDFIIGMLGDDELVNPAVANIMLQTAVLHCYTDVRIAAFFKNNEYDEFSWLRWLPHTFSEDMKLRMTACDSDSYTNVLYHIDEELRRRAEKLREENKEQSFYPHYVVLCTDRDIFDGDGIEKYIPMAKALGFTFILAYKRLDRLPNECERIVQCDSDFSGTYSLSSKRGETDRVEMDHIALRNAENLSKQISRLRVREYATGEIPTSIEYFEMIGIGRLEQWDLIKKYKENRVYEGIRSFVGIGSGGKPIYIDVHEKKYGPHGLVAGTTGSGKSETLQTFIISLALNYHPDEVAFILIDYKGGGMAYAFEGMPHIAGMITNLGDDSAEGGELDSNITRRALVSVRSEIKYRQAIFNRYKVNHIDAYIKLYREGTANEPLPHLIIISDEFAELKKEQPEFIKELVSTARVGRSLGIHLILATQKPGGVVDDEIWSNSRFKLCLRVQDKQDSMGMLKRPEAAYLTQTGRAYLQIGNDEIFEQFQTGYSGADYEPKEQAGTASSADLMMINIDGTEAVVKESGKKHKKKCEKQLKAAVDYIIKICDKNSIKATRALWLDELEKNLVLDDVENKYTIAKNGIRAVIGVIDDPEKQRQIPAVIDITACSNLLIAGAAGMGKTTMLQTMLISVMKSYTCEQAIFYILDFSSRILKLFSSSKHCGLVALSDDREAVIRMFCHASKEMNRRKELFNSRNVGSYSEYIKSNSLPLMMIIVDNFYSFNELYPELADDFMKLTRDCAKYGIQVIITCNNLNDIRYKLRQNFTDTLTLVMLEKGDYRDAWGVTAEFMPKNTKGRGLILCENRLLEYQTALPCAGNSESERYAEMTELINRLNTRDEALTPAAKVKTIPLTQSYADFFRENKSSIIPLGYNTDDISIYGLSYTETFCYAVSEAGTKGISLTMNNLMYAAKQEGHFVYSVKLKNDIKLSADNADVICRSKSDVVNMLASLREKFTQRAVDKKAFLAQNSEGDFAEHLCKNHDKFFIFIDSMNEFLNMIYDPANEENMYAITETYFKNGMGMGIYFIAGFEQAVYEQNYYRAACKNFTAYKQGIHLGGRYDKQKFVEVNMSMSQMTKSADYFTGLINTDGKEIKIFVPGGKSED